MSFKIITISREFGSGGRFIGEQIAQKCGIEFYDKKIIEHVAKEVKELTKHKKFGLVFENHVSEMTLLYDYPISSQADSQGYAVVRTD